MSGRSAATPHAEWSTYTSKSFITTQSFSTELYSYTLTRSGTPPFAATGSLLVSGASAANCPAGRVLHTNGKKLTPGANPMNAFTGGATVTSAKFMVGVYDPESMLNGYIDPTSPTFAVYDKNRPAADYLIDFTSATAEATALASLGGQGSRLPAKVLIGNPAVGLTATPVSNNTTTGVVAAGSSSVGKFTATFDAATNNIANGAGVAFARVNTTAVTASSVVLLTSCTDPAFIVTVTDPPSTGFFVVRITNATGALRNTNVNLTVNWLVVN